MGYEFNSDKGYCCFHMVKHSKPSGKSRGRRRSYLLGLSKRGRNGAETIDRKEGENGGFDASGAIIRRSNNGTKATDVVCTSI